MTMTARIGWLLAAVVSLSLLGGLWIHTLTARDALQLQLALRNQDAAGALALSLSQQRGDAAAIQTVAAAQFEVGAYRSLLLTAPDGRVVLRREQAAAASAGAAPLWFTRWLPLSAAAGEARVGDGWRPLGTLRIESHQGWAHDALWAAVSRTAALLAGLGVLAALMSVVALRGWQRPLDATVRQARALEEGRFTLADEPAMPELRTLTRSMNAMVLRLREMFDAQAAQVALLQRQAQTDPVTGLMQRRLFVARLESLLDEPAGPGFGLLLLRVARLEQVNHEMGFAATDRLLAALAEVLQAYGDRVSGAFAGRLNGSDFALVLPAVGVAAETAASLDEALAQAPLARAGAVRLAIGGADGLRAMPVSAAMGLADAALAEAEVSAQPVVHGANGRSSDPSGARAWRAQIAAALEAGRTRLAEFPVVDRDGLLLHLECPLRVQFEVSESPQAQPSVNLWRPARQWLAQAARSRLLPQVDLAALELALAASAADAQPRSVHIADASMAEPGFVARVQERLAAQPAAARRLSLEWLESARRVDRVALRDAAASWRALGVRLGVEHAGATPQALAAWQVVGIDYVKIDARHVQGAADDEAVRAYASSLVALVHGLGWTALAEGIEDPRDLDALWALGFDGATGRAVSAQARR